MKVLIVDDHDEFRGAAREMLEEAGHVVEEAKCADEAIPLVNAGAFDVVVVDFSMPVHSGLWFMQRCSLPARTRVLFVTAHISKPLIDRMLKAGATGYLLKPFTGEQLVLHPVFHHDDWPAGSTS